MKIKFRTRIMIAIVVVTAISVLIIAFASYMFSKKSLEENYVHSINEKMSLQVDQFDEIMKELYLNVQRISHRGDLREEIQTYLSGKKTDLDSMNFAKMLRGMINTDQTDYTLWVYIPEAEQMFSTLEYYPMQELSSNYLSYWQREETDPFKPLFYMDIFSHSAKYVYAYERPVYDEEGNVLARVAVTTDERQLYYDLLGTLNASNNETYMILDSQGKIASARQMSKTGQEISELKNEQSDQFNGEIGTDGMLYTSIKADFSGFRMMCSSDLKQLTGNLKNTLMLLVAIAGAVLAVMTGVSIMLSLELSRPIGELVNAMDQVRSGDFSARVIQGENDEFSVLQEHFNDMASRMEGLTDAIVTERIQKKEAEINALQYQIRPHFMYNTLNSIRFAAVMQGNQKLAGLLQDYTALLEASIQRNGAFISLKEEILLVKNYLSLQAFRYADCFTCEFDIQQEAEGCFVPCLILQPIIENAVFHGIDPKRNDNELSVSGWILENTLNIKIRDNGEGFEYNAEDESAKKRFTGIGLNNIQDRLSLYYGNRAKFTIISSKGQGTSVEIRLPVSLDPKEYKV